MDETKEVSFQPAQLFFYPPHRGGDKEFDGHGPNINVIATVFKVSDLEIGVQVYMDAIENKKDFTHFSGTSDRAICFSVDNAHPGWRVLNILSDQTSSLTVMDSDHAFSEHGPDTGSLVKRFTIHGDQKGEDKPWIRVDFNPITVRLINSKS